MFVIFLLLVLSFGRTPTYKADGNQHAVVFPIPKTMTSGNDHYKFHRCGVTFNTNHDMMKDIIEVYKKITFETEIDCKLSAETAG